MGVYVVTGGTRGIGEATAELLRSRGHAVIETATKNADVCGDLGTGRGRAEVIEKIHRLCPAGIDGLVCCHGIAPLPRFELSRILSVNYFGAVAVIQGLYDLLKAKRGSCVVTLSAVIAGQKPGKYFVDDLLLSCGDEARIGRLVDSLPCRDEGIIMYTSAKLALSKWVRRSSASWGINGVNLNAVAPGAVETAIMENTSPPEGYFFPMPLRYAENRDMTPESVAQALAYMVLPEGKGINGQILFCDAGAAAVFDPSRPF